MKSIRRVIISAMLFAVAMFTLSSAFTIKTYASEGNGEASNDTGVGKASDNLSGHACSSRTFWLVYLTDDTEPTGKLCSNVVAAFPKGKTYPASANTQFLLSRIGNKAQSSAKTNSPLGVPVTPSGVGRGAEVKNWLITANGRGSSNAGLICRTYLGEEAYKLFTTEPEHHYLICEACSYHCMFKNYPDWYAMSSSHVPALYAATGANMSGGATAWMDTRRLQIGAYLSLNWKGLPPVPTSTSGYQSAAAISNTGLGMVAVCGDEATGLVHTWDEENYQDGTPGYSEKKPTGTFNIVKTYIEEEIDKNKHITYKNTHTGLFKVTGVVGKISIDDEPQYKLKGWTITTATNPPTIDSACNVKTWYTKIPGSKTPLGSSPTVVMLDAAKKQTTVYVYLLKIKTAPDKEAKYNYEIPQSYITRRIFLSQPDIKYGTLSNPASITKHIYKFMFDAHEAACPGHTYKCKNDGTMTKCSSGKANYAADGKTITSYSCGGHTVLCGYGTIEKGQGYNHLGDPEFHFGLVDDPDYINSSWNIQSTHRTDTIVVNKKADEGLDKEHNEWEYVGQGTYARKTLSSWFANGKVKTTIDKTHSGYTGDDITTILHRGGKDILTIAKWKLDAAGAELPATLEKISGGHTKAFEAANKPSGTRYEGTFYNAAFSMSIIKNNAFDYQTTYDCITPAKDDLGNVIGHCSDTRSAKLEGDFYSLPNIKVKVDCYKGYADGAYNDKSVSPYGDAGPNSVTRSDWSDINNLKAKAAALGCDTTGGTLVDTGRTVNDGESISFYPYILMSYHTQTAGTGYQIRSLKHGAKNIYVLSEYSRSITPNSFAELTWYKQNNKYNLDINSTQFSTHSQAYNDHPTADDTAGVLPGGAEINATIPKGKYQVLYVTTYQPVLIDGDIDNTDGGGGWSTKGRTQVEKTGYGADHYTKERALGNHNSYVESIVDALSNTDIWQYQSKKLYTGTDGEPVNKDIFNHAIQVFLSTPSKVCSLAACTGCGNRETSEDLKYYFKLNTGNLEDTATGSTKSDRAALDVKIINEDPLEAHCWFGTNCKGGYGVVNGQGDTNIAADVNKFTAIDTKLQNGLELDASPNSKLTGKTLSKDADAKVGEVWYNEQFDSIAYYRFTTAIMIGTNDPAVRTSILDTMLTPSSTGVKDTNGEATEDLFTKYYVDQFRVANYSNSFGASKPQVLGTFLSKDILTKEMELLFRSKKIYIPNVTVQDLH